MKDKMDDFIKIVCDKITYKPIRKDISDELKGHSDELKQRYIDEGLSGDEAQKLAIKEMGNPEDIGSALNKIHKPKMDYLVLVLIGILTTLGAFTIYSLSGTIYKNNFGSTNWGVRHIICIVLALIIGIGIYFCNYTKSKKISTIIFTVSTLLGIASLWIRQFIIDNTQKVNILSFISITMVVLYIISFSGFLSKFNINKIKYSLLIILLMLPSLYLVYCCNNSIYLLVLFVSFISMFITEIFRESKYSKIAKKTIIATFIIVMTVLFATIIVKYTPYGIKIADMNIDPNSDIYFEKYISTYRKNILEHANFFGSTDIKGELTDQISINNWGYGLQDAEKTEILLYIIAKYGVAMGLFLITGIIILCIKIVKNIRYIKDSYGKCITIGFSILIIIPSILNILSNLLLIHPNAAVLPIISYSNLENILYLIVLFIVLSIYKQKDILAIRSKN